MKRKFKISINETTQNLRQVIVLQYYIDYKCKEYSWKQAFKYLEETTEFHLFTLEISYNFELQCIYVYIRMIVLISSDWEYLKWPFKSTLLVLWIFCTLLGMNLTSVSNHWSLLMSFSYMLKRAIVKFFSPHICLLTLIMLCCTHFCNCIVWNSSVFTIRYVRT